MRIVEAVKTLFTGGHPVGDRGALRIISNAVPKRGEDPADVIKKFRHWVYVCSSRNASTAASVPLRLYAPAAINTESARWYGAREVSKDRVRRLRGKMLEHADEMVELTDHPILDLLSDANPVSEGFTVREETVLHQELVGNAYWYLETHTDPVRTGIPRNIWPLIPTAVRIVTTPDGGGIAGYLYGTDPRTAEAYGTDEVIHFRYPNPTDSLYGIGPAQAAIAAVNRKEAMDEYRQALYDNHCRPDFVISVSEDTTDDEIRSLYKMWDRRFKARGSNAGLRAGRPWISTSDKEIKPLNFQPNHMGDIPQAKLDRDEIYQAFGNPLTMGEISKSRAEAETGEYSYMLHAILPRLIRMEQTLNERLCPLYDERLVLAFDNPVPEDQEAIHVRAQAGVTANVLTRNEGRQALGYDERPDCEGFLADFLAEHSAPPVVQRGVKGEEVTAGSSGAPFLFHDRVAARNGV